MKQSLRELKKAQNERFKTYISLPRAGHDALLQLMESEPDLFPSQIISRCLRIVAARDLLDVSIGSDEAPSKPRYESVKEVHARRVKDLVEKFGGTVRDNVCYYTRYETTPTGVVVKLDQSMGVHQMPEDPEAVRQMMLGTFATVTQAELAFTSQNEVPEEIEERVIKPKKRGKKAKK